MLRIFTILFLLVGACGDDLVPPEGPDAGLPSCAEIGCDNAFCDRAGVCTCVQDGRQIACLRGP